MQKPFIISFIVAAAENNVIGKDNNLPWNLPADMKYFKNRTWGLPVIMGRKSFDALGKALPGRKNFVVTRNPDWQAENTVTASSIEDAIDKAAAADAKEIFIIGGAEIFRKAMSFAEKIYLTRIHAEFDGDAFFPALNAVEWHLTSNLDFGPDEKNPIALSFQVWERTHM